jgi:hypothetical protein
MNPQARFVTIRIQDPIDIMAFDLSRSKPNDVTRVGAYEPIVWAGANAKSVKKMWGSRRQLENCHIIIVSLVLDQG